MFGLVLRYTFGHRRFKRGTSRSTWYAKDVSRREAESYQVEKFNLVWGRALKEVAFYQSWMNEHNLPEQISSLSELQEFPLLTKAIMVERHDEIFTDSKSNAITSAYSTGGTTGTPTRYPKGPGEQEIGYANSYMARGWWGIRPFDSYVHIWGHAHLFGNSRFAKLKRYLQDFLVNSHRLNAYDMTPEALASHAKIIIRRNPTYLVGYTSAIFRIARYIQENGIDTSRLQRIRAIIVTAETVTQSDVDLISSVFKAPVVIEYGAAETGVMAYSRVTSWPLQVLWRSFIVTTTDDCRMIVTTLENRIFPLINYSIGDNAEGGDQEGGNALTLGAITGRSQDSVTVSTLGGGHLELSAILPIHILKSIPGIMSVQYRQNAIDQLQIFITASRELDLDALSVLFAEKLNKDHADFDETSVSFHQIDTPLLTKSGKQSMFV